MKPKLFKSLLFALFAQYSTNAEFIYNLSPVWWFAGSYPGEYNIIPDYSATFHVTGIELGLCTDGSISTINTLGDDPDGVMRTHAPPEGCIDLSENTTTLSMGPNERVTTFEAWRNSDLKWYRIKITLNSGVTQEYNHAHAGIDTLHTFTIPPGEEFTGFYVGRAWSGCFF